MKSERAQAAAVRQGLGPWQAEAGEPEPFGLILGSFPSRSSLAEQTYYAHPRNHFWRLFSACLGENPPSPEGQRDFAVANGWAVWDVWASCEREGSLDQNIRAATPNSFEPWLAAHPIVRLVCNGSASAAAVRKFGWDRLVESRGGRVFAVPSSSPVPSRAYRDWKDKLPKWKEAVVKREGS